MSQQGHRYDVLYILNIPLLKAWWPANEKWVVTSPALWMVDTLPAYLISEAQSDVREEVGCIVTMEDLLTGGEVFH